MPHSYDRELGSITVSESCHSFNRIEQAGGKSDEDVCEVIIMDDSLRKLLPDLVILIEIEGVKWGAVKFL